MCFTLGRVHNMNLEAVLDGADSTCWACTCCNMFLSWRRCLRWRQCNHICLHHSPTLSYLLPGLQGPTSHCSAFVPSRWVYHQGHVDWEWHTQCSTPSEDINALILVSVIDEHKTNWQQFDTMEKIVVSLPLFTYCITFFVLALPVECKFNYVTIKTAC